MSANSPNKRNLILIGVIVVAGIGVTILNVQTFGPQKRPHHRRVQAGVMNQPALPADLAILVQEAMRQYAQASIQIASDQRELPRVKRDPFEAKTYGRAVDKPTTASSEAPKRQGLTCSAIMMGGQQPSACINGKFYRPGDQVHGFTLAWIATNGVTLQTSGGNKKFLPLSNKSTNSGALIVQVGHKS